MKKTFIWDKDTGLFVEIGKREGKAGPTVIQDSMDPLQHPCDGKMYDSRSAYDRVTREHGALEIGKEGLEYIRRKGKPEGEPVKKTIERAIYDLSQGYKPAPVETASGFERIYNKDD